MHTQFHTKIQTLRIDNGSEFVNKKLTQFLQNHGTVHQRTFPQMPKQNGRVERKHMHLIETIITLLHHTYLPLTYWVEALSTSNYLINRLPKLVLNNKLLFELLYHKSPSYDLFKPFGCLCYLWLRPYCKNKLEQRSNLCIFIRYSPYSKGYRCLDPTCNAVFVSRHVRL